ncbi:GGDEF domain-containing protein [Effusibacillus dendaii]|uniref:GGDEF domain-containing protein n=1 Tax=Effusibacillus dendaii TaxID=2743772 RepID=A0A7I8DGP3_9BACL|nr:GGDEF domain-containing protein [Effusibacillus dendaii]BCJ87750.1 hypothetical protein skT53_27350 [Effusibacillus dendaii]
MSDATKSIRFIWKLIVQYGGNGLLESRDLPKLEAAFLYGKWIMFLFPPVYYMWVGQAYFVPMLVSMSVLAIYNGIVYFLLRNTKNWSKSYSCMLRIIELFIVGSMSVMARLTMDLFNFNSYYLLVVLIGILSGGLVMAGVLLTIAILIFYFSGLMVSYAGGTVSATDAFFETVLTGTLFVLISFSVLYVVARSNRYRIESKVDWLTGLYNHRYFYQTLIQSLEDTGISRLTIILADIDDFKKINDMYGHLVGDEVLRKIGLLLRERLVAPNIAARYGGEEFGILLFDKSEEQVQKLLVSIQQSLAELTIDTEAGVLQGVTVSMGVVTGVSSAHLASKWVRLADQTLYRAKSSGKNRIVFAETP